MATEYRKTRRPRRPWRPADHAAFAEVLGGLKWESYPNGQCGWEDHALPKFEAAGFRRVSGDGGCPALSAVCILDLGDAGPNPPHRPGWA